MEWNGKDRDCVRDYWSGQDQTLSDFAYRLTGSSDLYEPPAGGPMQASTLSSLMTGSRFMIWFPTMKNTTKLTAKTIVTARVTTALGTAVSKDPPTIAK